MRQNKKLWLILVLLLALFLRFYRLGSVPAGFHADEAALGYNAYSLLLTGKDEYGRSWPLVLQSFDDYKPALYAYLAAPAVRILGLNELATRLPAALFGALNIILVYCFAHNLTKNDQISLLAAFFMAVSPWHLNLSRTATEAVIGLFFTLLGFCCLKRPWLAGASWLMAMFSYHTPRFFIPLIFLVWLFLEVSKKKKRQAILLFVFLLVAGVLITVKTGGGARIGQLSLFGHPKVILKLEEQFREGGREVQPYLARFFHNKLINYSLAVIENYGQYLNLNFLFLKGSQPLRAKIPDSGVLLLIEIIFLPLGLYYLLKQRLRESVFLIAWVLLGFLPTALTVDETPNIYRSLIVLPSLNIISALGIWQLKEWITGQKRLIKIFFGAAIATFFIWSLAYSLHQYYLHQEKHQPYFRHYGYQELVQYLKKEKENYDQVIISKYYGSPYIFFLFYTPYPPAEYQSWESPRDYDFGGFDQYIFVPHACPSQEKEEREREGRILFVNASHCDLFPDEKVIKTIKWQDNRLMFRLIEID